MAQHWVKHTLNQAGIQPQNQVVALALLAIFITLVFGGVYLSQIASFATLTAKLKPLLASVTA